MVSKLFLAPTLFQAKPANVRPKTLAYIHAGLEARLSPMNLQTISDI